MSSTEKSRVPLALNAALERMNLPPVTDERRPEISAAVVQGRVLQDYSPLSESLEWRIAQAHWDHAGVLPFLDSEVPYLVNNSGRLSADAATVFLAHCLESEALPSRFSVLEVGAGTGLFARYFLDCFKSLCQENGTGFYDRLTYVVTDRSPRTAAQWCERGLFEQHSGHVLTAVFDPADTVSRPPDVGDLRAIFCNYVLDVMPSDVVRSRDGVAEQMCVRTRLTSEDVLRHYSSRTAEELQALAASGRSEDLLELVPVLPLLEMEAAFLPVGDHAVPYLAEALEFAAGPGKILLNYGAIGALERSLELLGPNGVVMISDYGPVSRDQIGEFTGGLHRFGPTVAFGLDFPLLEDHFGKRGVRITNAQGDSQRGIHTCLLSRGDLPSTRAAFAQRFSKEAEAYFQGCLDDARAHATAGRVQEALDGYREALVRNPRNWSVIGEVGEFLAQQLRQFEAALDLLRNAVALNPWYSTWLWNALGDALYCLERYDDAHEAYAQAARIHPDDVRTNLNLAYTLALGGKLDQALAAIARGLARDSTESYRVKLLEKQGHLLTLLSARTRAERERLMQRSSRLHNA